MRLSNNKGFTLVEVVLAMALAAMVMATLFAALSLGQRAVAKGEDRAEVAQRVMVLSDRISWLLSGAYPYVHFDEEKGRERIIFSGQSDKAGFVTTSVDEYSGDIIDKSGLKYVNLHLEPEGMKASEKIFFMGEGEQKEYVIEPYVSSLAFAYLDGDSGQWSDNWDTEKDSRLPSAVKVSLRLKVSEDRERIVPPIIIRIATGGNQGL